MNTCPRRFVDFTAVTLSDAFWLPRIETNRRTTLAAVYRFFKRTGRIDAFKLDWTPGKPEPHIFWDSDVAKWIEAACCSLAATPDPRLERQVEAVIADILAAQQDDGYLNVHMTVVRPEARWRNLRDVHELYTAGHLIEAGVAHFRATGRRHFLDGMCRLADHIDGRFGRGPGQLRGYSGHEEIELALVRLYHATSERRYLRLAAYFVDERGRSPHFFDAEEAAGRVYEPFGPDHGRRLAAERYAYMQAHLPLRRQREVVGHAVRAMYIYAAMADLAAERQDAGLRQACEALWEDLTLGKMYVTGGIGSSKDNEGFTAPRSLPNASAYAETCAAIGLVFWAQRMLRIACDGRYADVMERALYNGVISGVSLDGRAFHYANPLASDGHQRRVEGFGCSCCPPNLARLLASLGGYLCSVGPGEVALHLYVAGTIRGQLAESDPFALEVSTEYPWHGLIDLRLDLEKPASFALALRIPGWCRRFELAVNGRTLKPRPIQGYLRLDRRWSPGDRVQLVLDMPVERVAAHPAVVEDQGRVALQRGPLVYCVEDVDHRVPASRLILPDDAVLRIRSQPDLLGGVVTIRGRARVARDVGWQDALYRPLAAGDSSVALTAVPYYAWGNRAAGSMAVWLPRI